MPKRFVDYCVNSLGPLVAACGLVIFCGWMFSGRDILCAFGETTKPATALMFILVGVAISIRNREVRDSLVQMTMLIAVIRTLSTLTTSDEPLLQTTGPGSPGIIAMVLFCLQPFWDYRWAHWATIATSATIVIGNVIDVPMMTGEWQGVTAATSILAGTLFLMLGLHGVCSPVESPPPPLLPHNNEPDIRSLLLQAIDSNARTHALNADSMQRMSRSVSELLRRLPEMMMTRENTEDTKQ